MSHPVDDRSRRLVHVKYAAAAVEETLHSLREAVRLARSAGVSWTQIGEALDISPQAALEEFDVGSSKGST